MRLDEPELDMKNPRVHRTDVNGGGRWGRPFLPAIMALFSPSLTAPTAKIRMTGRDTPPGRYRRPADDSIPTSGWPTIRPEGQMDAPLECSMCGIRCPYISAHLSALSRRHSSLYCGPKGARISSERSTISPRRTSATDQRGVRGVGSSFFRLLQLHLRNWPGLDQRVELLHVGIPFSNSGED
jgi:hypothetical protein